MQQVIEYRKLSFWSSRVDMNALNEKIAQLNQDGWHVKSVTPHAGLFGSAAAYTLLIEKD